MNALQIAGIFRARWWRIPLRVIVLVIAAYAIGAILNRVSVSLNSPTTPAGFARGALQGALMPMALPNLLVGRDVSIYSDNNAGVPYKLGYTAGVNACGAAFFGLLYWRLHRLRSWASQQRLRVPGSA